MIKVKSLWVSIDIAARSPIGQVLGEEAWKGVNNHSKIQWGQQAESIQNINENLSSCLSLTFKMKKDKPKVGSQMVDIDTKDKACNVIKCRQKKCKNFVLCGLRVPISVQIHFLDA